MITENLKSSIESDLLQKTEVLAFFLHAVAQDNPEAGRRLAKAIIERLEGATSVADVSAKAPAQADGVPPLGGRHSRPVLVAAQSEPGDEIEEFILENVGTSGIGLSVQELVDRLDEARIDIRRPTLVVRLHRMVRAGKLVVRSHGHYALSEVIERRSKNA